MKRKRNRFNSSCDPEIDPKSICEYGERLTLLTLDMIFPNGSFLVVINIQISMCLVFERQKDHNS